MLCIRILMLERTHRFAIANYEYFKYSNLISNIKYMRVFFKYVLVYDDSVKYCILLRITCLKIANYNKKFYIIKKRFFSWQVRNAINDCRNVEASNADIKVCIRK